uniref:(northern house mosquito) hypothetical protein n=1 Tax=Culex pipiens TaxID=7175 RepID=A0A8D8N3I5_CULPI
MGAREVQGVPQVLPHRVPVQAVRGARPQDRSGAGLRAPLAGEGVLQARKATARRRQCGDAAEARPRLVDASPHEQADPREAGAGTGGARAGREGTDRAGEEEQ